VTFYLFSLAEVYSNELTACNTEKLNRGQGFGSGTGTSQCTEVHTAWAQNEEDSDVVLQV